MAEKIKKWLGIGDTSPYVQSYFDSSNIRASVYMSIMMVALETWMIVNLLGIISGDDTSISSTWIILQICTFIMLFLTGILTLKTSENYLNGKITGREKYIIVLFCVISVLFGIFISSSDYGRGEQIFTFVTIMLFTSCFLVWKPVISIFTVTLAFIAQYACMCLFGEVSAMTTVCYAILWISILIVSINNYKQKLAEALKADTADSATNKLNQNSVMDQMTGLANMDFFRRRAKEIITDSEIKAKYKVFLFFDIENFKVVNSKYGFSAGSAFLVRLANAMTDFFPDALIARQADDHFVVLTDRKDSMERIEAVRKYVYDFDPEINIGLKVGAYIPKDDQCDPIVAIDCARSACQSIKKRYECDYCEYDNAMDEDLQLRQYIVNSVDTALDNGDIMVYYQPVVWSRNRKLCGFEALVKWNDPTHGFLSPGLFIPVLEEYRQVHKVDMIVVDTVFRNLRKMKDMGLPVVPVSLNFSRLDFELTDVVDLLESCVQTYGIERDLIHVEVTESAVSDNLDSLKRDLKKLKSLGYPLWLDDFGSGYSSLNVLKDFDFDVVKIDMVFLSSFEKQEEKTKAVLKNVVQMCSDLGMMALTEGVETVAQSMYLHSIGCDKLQGYLFGKPMPLNEIIMKINAGTLMVSEEFIDA